MIRNNFLQLLFPPNQFKKAILSLCSVQCRRFLSDCSSIIWTLDDADPVVLRVYTYESEHLLLCIQQSFLNKTSQYMTEKMCYRSFKSEPVCYIILCPNIDRKLKLFSIWLQKCSIDHSNLERFAVSFFFQTLMESSRMYWIRYGWGDCLISV